MFEKKYNLNKKFLFHLLYFKLCKKNKSLPEMKK